MEPQPSCLDDDAAVAFVDGMMSTVELDGVEAHLDGCSTCRRHLAALVRARTRTSDGNAAAPAPRPLLPPGEVLGRYRIRGVLGVGAMGVVYAAHDAQLNRMVALKMMRAHGSGERLLAEAQALARLRDPHVVTVHEVGSDGDRVFIAMELVHGKTLTAWLAEPRSVADTVAVLAQAGRGLGAAHAAGLVHRDFKPDNVLVGDDGRVCVTDFGLARAADADHAPVVAGTPAYMSPEQHRGEPADARSDQFAFCVALWEALYGARPFDGVDNSALAAEVAAGVPRLPATRRRVPARLAQALRRGLRPAAAERFPSMTALLQAIDRGSRSRLRSVAVAIAVLCAVTTASTFAYVRGRRASRCPPPETRLAGVWDATRRTAVKATFADRAETQRIVTGELDRYARRWAALDGEACAAVADGRRTETARAAQSRCLERRLRERDTLARVLSEGDAAVVGHGAEAVYALSSVEDCADVAQLPTRPARDAATEKRLAALEDRLAEARAYEDAGKYAAGLDAARPVLVEARSAADRGLEAEAALAIGRLSIRTADFAGAEQQLNDAVLAAEAGRRDELRAAALSKLVAVVGVRLRRLADGAELARRADAVVERLAGEPRLKSELLYAEGMLAASQGDYAAAAARYRQALTMLRGTDGEVTAAANIADGLGMTLYDLGQFADGLVQLRAGLATRERLFGPKHMSVSFSLNNIAVTLEALDRPREAKPLVERALAIGEATVGVSHPDVAASLQILADAEASLGDYDAADEHFRRALAIMEKTFGADSPNLTNSLSGIARVAAKRRRFADGEQALQRALAIKQKALGPAHPELATAYDSLASNANARGDFRAAVADAEDARKLQRPDSDPSARASVLINLGHAQAALGRLQPAIDSLERAVELLTREGEKSPNLAEARFELAQVLWKTGAQPRALSLATAALGGYGDETRAQEHAAVAGWLASRGGRAK